MKQISLQDLKRRLSHWVGAAAGGESILISRYRRPIARLGPAGGEGLHVGSRAGRADLRPLFHRATQGRFLSVLLEDRQGDEQAR